MCEPLMMLGFAASAAQSVVGYMGQEAQYEIQQQQYAQNRRNAISAFQDKQVALNQRQQQESVAAANDKFNTNLQAQAAESKSIAAAGEAGVSGTSINELIGDIEGRANRYDTNVNTNLDWTKAQLESEKTAAGDQAVSQINSVSPGIAPNFADVGLRIAGSGLNTYAGYVRTSGNDPLNLAGIGR